ncbi:SEC-C metal-binding domain-containing protein [Dyella flava]|uniref:SEC-C metal-binding domain-containing protein n=1 Tax=Dyella flava TaxID=1920170 RepID=UPI00195E4DB4
MATRSCFEKLGRNDPCPCGSARLFQELLHARWSVRRCGTPSLREIGKGGFGRPSFFRDWSETFFSTYTTARSALTCKVRNVRKQAKID